MDARPRAPMPMVVRGIFPSKACLILRCDAGEAQPSPRKFSHGNPEQPHPRGEKILFEACYFFQDEHHRTSQTVSRALSMFRDEGVLGFIGPTQRQIVLHDRSELYQRAGSSVSCCPRPAPHEEGLRGHDNRRAIMALCLRPNEPPLLRRGHAHKSYDLGCPKPGSFRLLALVNRANSHRRACAVG
jgi:hypothetical protein